MSKPALNLVEGPIGRNLLLFALPILAGNVAQSLNGSINAIWIGRFLGEEALTAATNANSILFFLIGSAFGLGMAATVLIAQAIGAGDVGRARRVMGTSASFFAALSLLVAVVGFCLARPLLVAMNTPAASLPLAEAYLRVIFLAMPAIYLFAFLSSALRGSGDARTPFIFLLLSVLLDVGLNPLLIFGAGPIPALGIAGAAWATLIAQSLALAALLLQLRRHRHLLWLGRAGVPLLRIDRSILRALIGKGVPMALQMVVLSLAMIALIRLVNRFGTDTAAGYGAALQLWNYLQMPAMAIGAACSSMAAQNVGAGHWPRVDAVARAGVCVNFAMTGALIAPLVLFDHTILALFLPAASPALEIARHLNHIVVGSFLLFGVTFVLSGVVRATGAVIAPLLLLVLSLWGIRLPLAELLIPQLGVDAIWWSFPISSIAALLMSLAYYHWGGWRRTRIAVPAPASLTTAAIVTPTAPEPPVS